MVKGTGHQPGAKNSTLNRLIGHDAFKDDIPLPQFDDNAPKSRQMLQDGEPSDGSRRDESRGDT